MIKKFNEDYHDKNPSNKNLSMSFEEFLETDEPADTIRVSIGDNWYDAYKRAKNLAVMKNKKVIYDFNDITHIITAQTDRDKIYQEYNKNLGKKERRGIIIGGDEDKKKEVNFDIKNFDVVGLPSGQIIYMNLKQINYFKARNMVIFIKVWKRPTKGGGIIPIELNKYAFEDPNYHKITDMMETITWE